MRSAWMTLVVAALLLSQALAAQSGMPSPQPNPRHAPRAVTEFQLRALQHVDEPVPDAGFAVVFRFSSPENRSKTGPLPRFSKMLRSGYGELINHRSAKLLATVQQGDQALQPVEVTTRAGSVLRYVFVLRRQTQGSYRGCWMTDSVIPPEDAGRAQET